MVYSTSNGPQDDIGHVLGPCSRLDEFGAYGQRVLPLELIPLSGRFYRLNTQDAAYLGGIPKNRSRV